MEGILHRHRHRGVVDVLRGEAEVDELLPLREPQGVETLLEEVLHGLHVVVRNRFEILDLQGVLLGELLIDGGELLQRGGGNPRELRQPLAAEGYEILNLHLHAVADKGELREILVEARSLRAVATVDRRDSRKRSQFHTIYIVCLYLVTPLKTPPPARLIPAAELRKKSRRGARLENPGNLAHRYLARG